ncbi:hypothetical protein RBA41_21590 [Massilia sp. CCM 9210]|uniref:hypothetical protein n=1 Tax=Massilia scottii TaxID=3057166 RepID=UPI002796D0E9|nr:hypothetical protein [Massilia sp. CCM 9210]MDQ1815893.1 hypothetical protein [Massilia sp. CCM 9210]
MEKICQYQVLCSGHPAAEPVRMLHAEAGILAALSDRTVDIAGDRVEWLRKGIEASLAKAAARRLNLPALFPVTNRRAATWSPWCVLTASWSRLRFVQGQTRSSKTGPCTSGS